MTPRASTAGAAAAALAGAFWLSLAAGLLGSFFAEEPFFSAVFEHPPVMINRQIAAVSRYRDRIIKSCFAWIVPMLVEIGRRRAGARYSCATDRWPLRLLA